MSVTKGMTDIRDRFNQIQDEAQGPGTGLEAVADGDRIVFRVGLRYAIHSGICYGVFACVFLAACMAGAYQFLPPALAWPAIAILLLVLIWFLGEVRRQCVKRATYFEIDIGEQTVIVDINHQRTITNPIGGPPTRLGLQEVNGFLVLWHRGDAGVGARIYAYTQDQRLQPLTPELSDCYRTKEMTRMLGLLCNKPALFIDDRDDLAGVISERLRGLEVSDRGAFLAAAEPLYTPVETPEQMDAGNELGS